MEKYCKIETYHLSAPKEPLANILTAPVSTGQKEVERKNKSTSCGHFLSQFLVLHSCKIWRGLSCLVKKKNLQQIPL